MLRPWQLARFRSMACRDDDTGFQDAGPTPVAEECPTAIQSQRKLAGRMKCRGSSIPSTCLRRKSPTKKSMPSTGAGQPKRSKPCGKELEKPARDAVNWLKRQGWIDDPAKVDDYVQDVVIGMLNRTGAVPNWRNNVGFRRATASMLARRYASQGGRRERKRSWAGMLWTWQRETSRPRRRRVQQDSSRGNKSPRGHSEGHRRACSNGHVRQWATTKTKFVDALDSLNDPAKAMDALDVLDRLSARYEKELPQVRRAVERIQRHLEPLMEQGACRRLMSTLDGT